MKDSDVKGLDVESCYSLLQKDQAVLIDIREKNEWDQANIPGAFLVPLSGFDPDSLPKEKDKIAIYHCRSGQRTATYFGLFAATGYKDIFHMEGGIIAWNEAGFPVNFAK